MRIPYLLPVLLLTLLSGCSAKKPKPCFTFSINENVVTFDPSCTEDAEEYIWTFGDGQSSTDINATHAYAQPGTYLVVLTVQNGSKTSNFGQTITVTFDPCAIVNCVHGNCVEGVCICDPGYEGTDCSTPINAKFNGTYTLNEFCNASHTYTVAISPSATFRDRFEVTGLWRESQFTCEAIISNIGEISIPRVPISTMTSVPREIASNNMSSTEDGTTIAITYTVYDGSTSTIIEQCVATLNRL